MKAGIEQLHGRTISEVIVAEGGHRKLTHVFLVFTDGFYVELYGSDWSCAGGLDKGGPEAALKSARNMGAEAITRFSDTTQETNASETKGGKDTETRKPHREKEDALGLSEDECPPKLKPDEENSPKKITLTAEQRQIINFVYERDIEQLIHFTRYENLSSILAHGLVTHESADKFKHIVYSNDALRLDGRKDSISLSLSFPNHRMFYKYRNMVKAEGWIVLAIDPVVLWEYECAFCKYNAADSRISRKDKSDLSGIRALREMFSDNIEGVKSRSEQRLKSFDPTDPQAEVLVFQNIPTKHILGVGFEDPALLLAVQNEKKPSHIKFIMAERYFNTREYCR